MPLLRRALLGAGLLSLLSAAALAVGALDDWSAPASAQAGPQQPGDLPALPVQPVAASAAGGMAYVALGDSLTAGMQSAGLTAQGQYAAYPAVVARLTDVPFGIPATRGLGCPPPMGGPLPEDGCQRVRSDIRGSNFAVPGARVEDLLRVRATDVTDPLTRRLYTLILGPRQTQVEAALKSKPAYLTLWIGANNAMLGVSEGDPALATPPAEFEREYRALLTALRPAGARTLLLTVPDVTRLPLMTAGPTLFEKGVAQADCQSSPNRVALTKFTLGQPLSCEAPYALTPAETAQLQTTVDAYNDAIYRLAGEFGADVMNVDTVMSGLDMHPAHDETAAHPFGADVSDDGVHLSAQGQQRLGQAVTDYVHHAWDVGLPPASAQELAAAGFEVAD